MITNPSAKYDASGNAGIINIRLKKNKNYGANGNIASGVAFGHTPKYNNSLSLNYRNKKINIFSNYSNNYGKTLNLFNLYLSLIHISEPTRRTPISYAVFC